MEGSMGCPDYLEMISQEVDGELEERQALPLMRHLSLCEGCREEYRSGLQLREMLRREGAAGAPLIPADFAARVIEAIEREERAVSREASSPAMGMGERLRSLFPVRVPPLSWSFALSLLLVASLSFFYRDIPTGESPHPLLADAKELEARPLQTAASATRGGDDDFNYYARRHATVAQRQPGRTPATFGGGGLIRAGYTPGGGAR